MSDNKQLGQLCCNCEQPITEHQEWWEPEPGVFAHGYAENCRDSMRNTIRHLQERLEGQRGLVEAAERFREAEAAYVYGEHDHELYMPLVDASNNLLAIARQSQPPPDERGAVEGQEV